MKKSEGIRRVTLFLSCVLALSWIVWALIKILPYQSVIVGGIGAFFLPQLISLVGYWFIEGFREDNKE